MKNLFKISIALFAIFSVFTSCKKDTLDLEESVINHKINGSDKAWAEDYDISFWAYLVPGTISEDKVDIKVTSEADPEGFIIEGTVSDYVYEGDDAKYNTQSVANHFDAAAITDADKKWIKVNPDGDVITVTIGDNIITETIEFTKPQDPLLVSNISISGDGYISGDVRYYNEDTDLTNVQMYSNTQETPITVDPYTEISDDGYAETSVDLGRHFGYTIYNVVLVYRPEDAPGFENEIVVDSVSDNLYVIIDDQTFSVPFENKEQILGEIMTPAK